MEKIKFKSEEEWLKERKKYIGASDASIIMGVSKWKLPDGRIKTPRLLWEEKVGLLDLSSDNSATRYGKAMEEPARLEYQKMVKDLFEPICVRNIRFPYAMVSLDGLNATGDKMVEIKNVSREDHELACQGKIPDKYYPQVQMQIMVTDLPENDYFSFKLDKGVIVTVKRDEEYIGILQQKLEEFWWCVENFKEPSLTEYDFVEKDLQWKANARELYEIKRRKKELCLKEKELQEKLELLSNGHNCRSGPYFFTRSVIPGRVSYKSIPELLNRDLDEFRGKPIISWRLRRGEE